jgi:hypothetical protein
MKTIPKKDLKDYVDKHMEKINNTIMTFDEGKNAAHIRYLYEGRQEMLLMLKRRFELDTEK